MFQFPFSFWQSGAVVPPAKINTASTTLASGGSGASLSITFAAAPTAGQYILLAALSNTAGGNTISTPSGFTQLYGDGSSYALFAKKATGSEGATFTVSNFNIAGILEGMIVGGCGPTPLDLSNKNTSATGPTVTTTHVQDLLASFLFSTDAPSVPAGWTLLLTVAVGAKVGGPLNIALATLVQPAIGASSAPAWSSSGPLQDVVLAITPT